MRILEGTPRELFEYESLVGRLGDTGTFPADAGTSTEDDDSIDVFIRQRFTGPAQEFALAYISHSAELGVRPEIRRSAQTPDGRSKYLPIVRTGVGWSGTVVYIHRARVEFRLRHQDVIGLNDLRVERRVVQNPDAQEFQITLRRQRAEDVNLALLLTRRALAKVLSEDEGL